MGIEFLICMAIAYFLVSPDPVSLAATRGMAGATQGAVRGGRSHGGTAPRSTVGTGRTSSKAATPPKTSSKSKKRTGSSATGTTQRHPFGWLGAVIGGAVQGWRGGVQQARERRTEGKDLWGRMHQDVTWTVDKVRAARQRKAEKKARLADATAALDDPAADIQDPAPVEPDEQLSTTTQDPKAPGQNTDQPEPSGNTKKGFLIMTSTIAPAASDLESLSSVEAEVEQGQQAAQDLMDAWAALRAWKDSLNERWTGTEWGTTDLDTSIASVGESETPEDLIERLPSITAAVTKAKSISEVVAEQGAKGDVARFAS